MNFITYQNAAMACSVPDQFAILIFFTIIVITDGFLFGTWTTPAYEIQSRCPPRSYQEGKVKIFRDKCYNFVTNREVYWADARDSCIRKGGMMVIIDDAATQQFIYTSLKSLDYGNHGIWIGLTDKNHELSWVWANGEPLGHYAYWGSHQGSGAFHQLYDCAYIRYSDDGKWHDAYCHTWPTKYSFICQFDANPTTTMPTTTTTARPTTESTTTTLTTTTTTTARPTTQSTTTRPTTERTTTTTTDFTTYTDRTTTKTTTTPTDTTVKAQTQPDSTTVKFTTNSISKETGTTPKPATLNVVSGVSMMTNGIQTTTHETPHTDRMSPSFSARPHTTPVATYSSNVAIETTPITTITESLTTVVGTMMLLTKEYPTTTTEAHTTTMETTRTPTTESPTTVMDTTPITMATKLLTTQTQTTETSTYKSSYTTNQNPPGHPCDNSVCQLDCSFYGYKEDGYGCKLCQCNN